MRIINSYLKYNMFAIGERVACKNGEGFVYGIVKTISIAVDFLCVITISYEVGGEGDWLLEDLIKI